MSNVTDNKRKFSREYILTVLGILLVSGFSAALVIGFRIKMKPYQIKTDQTQESTDTQSTDKNAPQNEIK